MSARPGLVGENCCLTLLCFLMNCFGKSARDNQELGWGRKSVMLLYRRCLCLWKMRTWSDAAATFRSTFQHAHTQINGTSVSTTQSHLLVRQLIRLLPHLWKLKTRMLRAVSNRGNVHWGARLRWAGWWGRHVGCTPPSRAAGGLS